MSNISFAEPWLLLLGIPLLAAVIVPFAISVRKINRTPRNIISLVCHILMVVTFTLGIAGTVYDAMITETQVMVLADVSYSSDRNLDVVDGYVRSVQKSLPKNSSMSLIAFGRDQQVLSELGEKPVSVRNATDVDTSATDIAGALRYAGNLFDDGVIKRIVIITDGRETVGSDKIASVVSKLEGQDIYIDAIYLDNTLTEGTPELQLTYVEHTASTFVGKKETADITVSSANSQATHIYVDVACGDRTYSYPHTVYSGENEISVPLDTSSAGSFEYLITVRPERSEDDTSYYNNACVVTQQVTESVKVLFIGGSASDCAAGASIYGDGDAVYISDPNAVPFTVEELCAYDEIVLCNFDVRTLSSRQQFVSSLDTVVSKFGKTLTTYGNTFIQETVVEENDSLEALGGMLPVSVGNKDQDGRLFIFVLDISLSMDFAGRKDLSRRMAEKLLTSLNTDDKVIMIGCSGDLKTMVDSYMKNKEGAIEKISEYEMRNGTFLTGALEYINEKIIGSQRFRYKELWVISDGLLATDAVASNKARLISAAEELSEKNVIISALGIYSERDGYDDERPLSKIVHNKNAKGNGIYRVLDDEKELEPIIGEVVEDVTEVCIEGDSYAVKLERPGDAALDGVGALPDIRGFWYSTAKTGSSAVLTARYYKDKVTSVEVPLYYYWNYGNGRVASFLSDISASSSWLSGWSGEVKAAFFGNVRDTMLPDERIELPFLVETETDGDSTSVRVTAPSLYGGASVTAELTSPDGSVQRRTLFFDTEYYICELDTPSDGVYLLKLTYDSGSSHYELEHRFGIPYYPEYDSFTPYNVASLYRLISENGELSADGTLSFDSSASATRSYTFEFTVPLMIACAALFIADIIVRMLRLSDLRSLFGKKRYGQRKKG